MWQHSVAVMSKRMVINLYQEAYQIKTFQNPLRVHMENADAKSHLSVYDEDLRRGTVVTECTEEYLQPLLHERIETSLADVCLVDRNSHIYRAEQLQRTLHTNNGTQFLPSAYLGPNYVSYGSMSWDSAGDSDQAIATPNTLPIAEEKENAHICRGSDEKNSSVSKYGNVEGDKSSALLRTVQDKK